jgi:hypothetical protein
MARSTGQYEGVVIQDFRSESEAIQAIERLQAAGFQGTDVSVIAKERGVAAGVADATGTEAEEGAVAGAVTGGALGALAAVIAGASAIAIPGIGIAIGGPIAAAIAGAAGGGLLGGLVGMGIPENEAKNWEGSFNEGNILVSVVAGPRADEARSLLRDGNVQDSDREFVINDVDRGSTGNTILDQSIGSAAGVATSTGTGTGMTPGSGSFPGTGSGVASSSGTLGELDPASEPRINDTFDRDTNVRNP